VALERLRGTDAVAPDASANCVVVKGKRGGDVRFAACMVLATTRADVNGVALTGRVGDPNAALGAIEDELRRSCAHGVLIDHFRMMARAARAASAGGTAIDPKMPPVDLIRARMVVVAYPLRCGDKDPVGPASIEIVAAQGQAPRRDGGSASKSPRIMSPQAKTTSTSASAMAGASS